MATPIVIDLSKFRSCSLLLIVLLAQAAPDPSWWNIPEMQRTWESLNTKCRTLTPDSPEGEQACSLRDILSSDLRYQGWCVKYVGTQIKWGTCPNPSKR
jgi:hypothetical protein